MIIAGFQNGNKLSVITVGLGGSVSNGTGTATGAPIIAASTAPVTVTVTKQGTLFVTAPSGSSIVVATGTATVVSGPVTVLGGTTKAITISGGATPGTITVTTTVNATATVIEIPELSTIQAVISASINGGYKIDPAAITIAGNKLTIQPYYFQDAAAEVPGPAIVVPTSVDLSAQSVELVVIGY